MTGGEFFGGADIDYGGENFPHAAHEFVLRYGFKGIAGAEKAIDQPVDIGQSLDGNLTERGQEPDYRLVGQSIQNLLTVLARHHKTGPAQALKMLRGIPDREIRQHRKGFDVSLALGKEFQKFEAMGVAQCLRDNGELSEKLVFGVIT
jgi:hypothetical protein